MNKIVAFLKDTAKTLATPAQYKKAIAAFLGPVAGTLALSLVNGAISSNEVRIAIAAGVTGFVGTFFTPPNAG